MYDALYSRQSVERVDSISIESQLEYCKYETRGNPYKEYIDRDYHEVALESAKAKAFRMPKVRPGILWFEVLLLCSLGMQLTGAYASMTTVIPILAVAVILLVWELHGSAKRQSEWEKELAKELEASKERLQDPAYLMELKKLDYPVTEDMIWQARNRVYGE